MFSINTADSNFHTMRYSVDVAADRDEIVFRYREVENFFITGFQNLFCTSFLKLEKDTISLGYRCHKGCLFN